MIKEHSVYVISEQFFIDFPDPYLKGNKEENRPHYYCLKDTETNLYWVIPLSRQVEKYKELVQRRIKENKPCDIIHIITLGNGKESAFLIQDMFPITENYIERPYTINKIPLALKSEVDIKSIHKKAKNVLRLIRKGIKFTPTQPDVLKIEKCLIGKSKKDTTNLLEKNVERIIEKIKKEKEGSA